MTDLDAEIMKNRRFREKYEPMLEEAHKQYEDHKARLAERSNYGEGHQIGEVEPEVESVEEETKEEAEKNSTEKTGEHE